MFFSCFASKLQGKVFDKWNETYSTVSTNAMGSLVNSTSWKQEGNNIKRNRRVFVFYVVLWKNEEGERVESWEGGGTSSSIKK